MHKINAFFNELPEWIFKLIAISNQTHIWEYRTLAKLIMDSLVEISNVHNVPSNTKSLRIIFSKTFLNAQKLFCKLFPKQDVSCHNARG